MIDSTNPRIMADNIRKLSEASGSGGSTVVPNPEGEATGNLSSLGIDGDKYTIPVYSPANYSTAEYNTGRKWIDNSDIYGIVLTVDGDKSVTSSWTTIVTDELIGTIDQLISCIYINVDNKGVYNIGNFKPNGNNLQMIYPITDGLTILSGAKIVIEYTKTAASLSKSTKKKK